MMANEKRLIDANALNSELIERQYSEQSMGILHSAYPHMMAIVSKQPTVDAVEVVRCKDCKFGDMCSIREAMAVSDWNAYCFRGERRTDD